MKKSTKDPGEIDNDLLLNYNSDNFYLRISGIIIMTFDTEGNIKDINDIGCEILEIDKEVILDKNWFEEFLPEENRDEIRMTFKNILEEKQSQFLLNENLVLTAKKNEKTIKWYNQIIRDKQNRIIGVHSLGQDITGYKNIETGLKKSKALFKGLIDTIADGIIIVSKEGTILYVNTAAENLFGKMRTELLGETFGFPLLINKVTEISILKKNGSVTIAEMRIAESEWDTDICFIASMRDITERKYAEKQQQTTTDILKILNEYENKRTIIIKIIECIGNLIDVEAVGVRLKDRKDYPFFYSKGLSSHFLKQEKYVFSHKPDHSIESDYKKLLPCCLCGNIILGTINAKQDCFTDWGSFVSNNIHETAAQCAKENNYLCERGMCLREGFISVASIPLRSGNESIGLLQLFSKKENIFSMENINILENIANSICLTLKRIIIEEELRESEERFRIFFEESPNYCFMVSPSGYILDVNNTALHNLGYSTDEIIGKKIFNFYPKASREKIHGIINNIDDKTIRNEELEMVLKDGSTRIVLLSITTVANENHKNFYIIFQQLDITEQKQLETKYLQAQKMEAIGTLAGGIAHDFNNILTIIKSYSEFLMDKLKGNILYPDVLEIHDSACRGATLTHHLLAFSRKQILQPRVIDINQLIKDITKILKRIIGEDIHLEMRLEDNLPKIRVDQGRMEQVIMNLAINSSDAMRDGGIFSITTSLLRINKINKSDYSDLTDGDYVHLCIKDNGSGIEKEDLRHIFDPFFTTKEPGKGTGLGLSVVYGIIRQHGGIITVESELENGTVFNIILPALHDNFEHNIEKEILAMDDSLHAKNSEKILFVEDDLKIRQLVTKRLSELHYIVFDVGTAEEATTIFDEHNDIKILFCDVILPGKSGLVLMEELLIKDKNLKILLTSGHSDEKSNLREIVKRNIQFIKKPYSIIEVAAAITKLISNKS